MSVQEFAYYLNRVHIPHPYRDPWFDADLSRLCPTMVDRNDYRINQAGELVMAKR